MTLRRAMLYVPGSSTRMLARSRQVPADTVCFDLEDSVELHSKAQARANIREQVLLSHTAGEIALRINAVETRLALGDLLHLPSPINTIVVPKAKQASEVTFVAQVLDQMGRGDVKLLLLVESAKALLNMQEMCRATANVDGLIFAAEDYAADVGIRRSEGLSEMSYARQAVVTCAAAHGVSAMDLVCTEYKRPDALQRECEDGAAMGMTGKQCIHPSQVDLCQRLFSPSPEKVQWANSVLERAARAQERGAGAFEFEGRMVDAPVIQLAQNILAKAKAQSG